YAASWLKGTVAGLQGGLELAAVDDARVEEELLLQLLLPLLAEDSGGDYEDAALVLGPELANDQGGLNGLAQANLVGEDGAAREGGGKGEEGGVELVGVEVHRGIEHRRADLGDAVGGAATGQLVSIVGSVIRGDGTEPVACAGAGRARVGGLRLGGGRRDELLLGGAVHDHFAAILAPGDDELGDIDADQPAFVESLGMIG